MSLSEISTLTLPGAPVLPESEAEILAALDGVGYLLMPHNGLPIILAVSGSKISAGACERVTETRLEILQSALQEAGFKPGESVDLAALSALDVVADGDELRTTGQMPPAPSKRPAEPVGDYDEEDLPFDEEDFQDAQGESDPYADEESDPDDEDENAPTGTEEDRREKLVRANALMQSRREVIVAAEIDAVMPAVLAWGIAGRGWGLPGHGDKPTREDVAGDTFLGLRLRRALLHEYLRPTLRGSQTAAALQPAHLFRQETPAS